MLVLQRNADHVLNDGCKRAGVDPKWLLEVIAEINLFVPDDWRLTRTTNNFRIRIVSHPCATFVGSCYRTHGDNILHIIDSLHLPGFHDCKDLRKRQHEFNKKITSNVKKKIRKFLFPISIISGRILKDFQALCLPASTKGLNRKKTVQKQGINTIGYILLQKRGWTLNILCGYAGQ